MDSTGICLPPPRILCKEQAGCCTYSGRWSCATTAPRVSFPGLPPPSPARPRPSQCLGFWREHSSPPVSRKSYILSPVQSAYLLLLCSAPQCRLSRVSHPARSSGNALCLVGHTAAAVFLSLLRKGMRSSECNFLNGIHSGLRGLWKQTLVDVGLGKQESLEVAPSQDSVASL